MSPATKGGMIHPTVILTFLQIITRILSQRTHILAYVTSSFSLHPMTPGVNNF